MSVSVTMTHTHTNSLVLFFASKSCQVLKSSDIIIIIFKISIVYHTKKGLKKIKLISHFMTS